MDLVLDFLMDTVGKIAATVTRSAEFDLGDFARVSRLGLDEFSLSLRADHTGETVTGEEELVSGAREVRGLVSLQHSRLAIGGLHRRDSRA